MGLPIPSAACALCGLIWVLPDPLPTREAKALFLGITAVLGWLMVSTFKYRSFKDVDLRSSRSRMLVPIVALILVAIAYLQEIALTALLVVFALSGPAARLVSLLRLGRGRKPAAEPR